MRHTFPTTLLILALLPFGAPAQSADSRVDPNAQPSSDKRPWVGVSVSGAPAALRHQLKVSDGVGLIVEFVQPKSPAAEAGIKPYDLLLKLDDQWLVNTEQFAVLIRMHHAGDEVKLSLLREGKEHTVTARLVDHEFAHAPWDSDIAPVVVPDALPQPDPPDHTSSRVLTWVDGHHRVSVTTTNGHTGLVVRDIDTGRVLFDGPIDTEEQRKSLPPEIRGLLDSLVKISNAFGAPVGKAHQKSPAQPDGQ